MLELLPELDQVLKAADEHILMSIEKGLKIKTGNKIENLMEFFAEVNEAFPQEPQLPVVAGSLKQKGKVAEDKDDENATGPTPQLLPH